MGGQNQTRRKAHGNTPSIKEERRERKGERKAREEGKKGWRKKKDLDEKEGRTKGGRGRKGKKRERDGVRYKEKERFVLFGGFSIHTFSPLSLHFLFSFSCFLLVPAKVWKISADDDDDVREREWGRGGEGGRGREGERRERRNKMRERGAVRRSSSLFYHFPSLLPLFPPLSPSLPLSLPLASCRQWRGPPRRLGPRSPSSLNK